MIQANRKANRLSARSQRALFLAAASLQLGCGVIFFIDGLSEWREATAHVVGEAFGVLALVAGAAITLREYFRLSARNLRVETELQAVAGAFQQVIEQHFNRWGLTSAERDVALLSIKGIALADIAAMRGAQPGTVKAQNAAIYRKAGVSGRAELISVFVEELIAGLAPSSPRERSTNP